jgi:hypothetical protein
MELGLSASLHSHLGRRAAPVACGAALLAAAGFVATHDPAASRSPYPGCIFHQMTGLWCPGCGLTRGTYQLLHGHIGAALGYNLFTPVALAAIVIAWWSWVRLSWTGSAIHPPSSFVRAVTIALPTLLILYGVLRNVPVAPLRALAP